MQPTDDKQAATADMVRRVCRRIDRAIDAGEPPPSLEELSRRVGLSPAHLQRTFSREMGMSPFRYGEVRRIDALKRELRDGESVLSATFQAGYESAAAGYRAAGAGLAMTPGRYRRGGQGERIDYACSSSPIGSILVAATRRGVCAVKMGNDPSDVVNLLFQEFPNAVIRRHEARVYPWIAIMLAETGLGAAVSGREGVESIPLDLRGTAFQLRVWHVLQRIPRGVTATYADVAREMGAPRSVRAVANACGRNPVAVLVPCHRVIGSDGKLHGYRWGVERKRRILDAEQNETPTSVAPSGVPSGHARDSRCGE